MSVDITGTLAAAIGTLDATAFAAPPAANPWVLEGANGDYGGAPVELKFTELFQVITESTSSDLEVDQRPGPAPVQATLPSAPVVNAPATVPDGEAIPLMGGATWVPNDSAAWFALHSRALTGGDELPVGGKSLPLALAEVTGTAALPESALGGPAVTIEVAAQATAEGPAVTRLTAATLTAPPLSHVGPQPPLEGTDASATTPAGLTRELAPEGPVASATVVAGAVVGRRPADQPRAPATGHEGLASLEEMPAPEMEMRYPSLAGLSAATGAARETLAAVQTAPLPPLGSHRSVARNEWDQAFSQRVVLLAQNRIDGAELRLDPPHLGTVHVKISQLDEQTQLIFQASHPHAREALESALPRLRDLFAQEGLQLASVQVSDRDPRQDDQAAAGDREQTPEGATARSSESADGASSGAVEELAVGRTRNRGLVDEFV